ncbi:DUF2115 domain-containing protein [Methanolobus bombayensis]|uniref:DUF2115 domain-containing protein n=1 Tax=Methanolobus bombayensis TaxID=38023 RepID=UPI001AE60673|nr:DUF2115 domain-containing protein [Methanolobus bombayensis]MBP1909083.1 uncharacterized protein (UPF0305 family) [Methanolobus bombayensis]
MNTSELLVKLQKDSREISNADISLARAYAMEAVEHVPEPYKTIYSADYFVFLYESFLKLKNCRSDEIVIQEIDPAEYEAALSSINEKNNTNDRKSDAMNRFITIVHIYLTFIVKKPLHPVGMVFPGGLKITEDDTFYYCPVKNKQTETGISFCEFCICKDSEEQ